jgi:hypothetical protein
MLEKATKMGAKEKARVLLSSGSLGAEGSLAAQAGVVNPAEDARALQQVLPEGLHVLGGVQLQAQILQGQAVRVHGARVKGMYLRGGVLEAPGCESPCRGRIGRYTGHSSSGARTSGLGLRGQPVSCGLCPNHKK